MKAFIIKISFFSVLVFTLAYCMDVFLSSNLQNAVYRQSKIWNDIASGNVNVEVAIYGSSRASQHINETALSDSLNLRCYNLGVPGYNFPVQYLMHNIYLRHNKKPKFIIQSLDYITLFNRDQIDKRTLLPYMLWNTEIQKYTKSYFNFTLAEFMLPMLRYIGEHKRINMAFNIFLKKDMAEYNQNDNQPSKPKWNNNTLYESNIKSKKWVLNDNWTAMFEKFIQQCNKDRIKLVLVYSPEYYSIQQRLPEEKHIIELYKQMGIKYNIPFLDYSTDTMNFNRNYFYNPTHLNKPGAEIFTTKLIKDLKALDLLN